MKKIRILMLLFLWSFSFADSLWETFLSFCTTWEKKDALNFVVESGVPYDFCLSFSTTSQEPVWVSLGFVDGEYTNDEVRNKACSYHWASFSPYVHFEDNFILVSSWGLIQKTGHLLFPVWYSWEIHWCVVYTIPEDKKTSYQNWSLFDVVVRKAKFIDGFVFWSFTRNISFLSGEIFSSQVTWTNDYLILVPFVNSWIVTEKFSYTGSLRNIFWYERNVSGEYLLVSWTSYVSFPFSNIPFYRGLYQFSFWWSSIIHPSLDVSYLPKESVQPLYFSYTGPLFFMPWKFLGKCLIILLAFFLLKIFLRKIRR